MYAAVTTQRSVGMVVLAVVVLGGIAFVIWQAMRGRAEVGSEIELAPNRKPYLADDELEGPKLNLALWCSFGLLVLIALALPLYWLAEGGRMNGAVKDYQTIFEARGLDTYVNGAQCQSCHGPKGTGGAKDFVINDEKGNFIAKVNWSAPALNTVLWRFSEAEVKDILTYGRPGSPMPAWGAAGGGPLSSQQLDNVIDYLWSIQLTNDQMKAEVDGLIKSNDEGLFKRLDMVRSANADNKTYVNDPASYECPSTVGGKASVGADGKPLEFKCLSTQDSLELGEILFNSRPLASGAYGCARCHVAGASYGKPWEPIDKIGTSRYAPSLLNVADDMTPKQHFALIMKGSENGKQYGVNHMGSGRMPGFGLNANNGDTTVPQLGVSGMLGPEEVWSIMVYERNLSKERPDLAAAAATSK